MHHVPVRRKVVTHTQGQARMPFIIQSLTKKTALVMAPKGQCTINQKEIWQDTYVAAEHLQPVFTLEGLLKG